MCGMGGLDCTFFSSVLSLWSSCCWCHTRTDMPWHCCIPNSPSSSTLVDAFALSSYHHCSLHPLRPSQQPHIPNIISSSFTSCHVSTTWIVILTNLWSSGSSCIMCHIIFLPIFIVSSLSSCTSSSLALHSSLVCMGPCALYHFSSSLLVHRDCNICFIILIYLHSFCRVHGITPG